MSSIGISLGVSRSRHASSEAPPESYVRTAFVSASGNDGTAVLNDPDLPFNNLNAAAAALYAAYAGLSTTIRLLSNIEGNIGVDSLWLLFDGLTIRSHDATRRTLTGLVKLYGAEHGGSSDLTLINVQITEVGELHETSATDSIGTLRADANSIIDLLTLSGSADGSAGGDGVAGGTDERPAASNGADGDPPSAGGDGEASTAAGTPGEVGYEGHTAWNISIVSEAGFTISQLNGFGKNGGVGGSGGAGGVATGGNGGSGGSALTPDGDGASGGNGGNANASGGIGGDGGTGGNGSTVTVTGSCTVTAQNLVGGLGGAGGGGGAGGTAVAGYGGAGGAGAGSGNPWANGTAGTSNQAGGGTGNSGVNGVSGSIV